MTRLLMLALMSVAALPPEQSAIEACQRLVDEGLECCKNKVIGFPDKVNLTECYELAQEPPNCETEICIAKLLGHANEDGTIIKKNIMKDIINDFDFDHILVNRILKVCVNGVLRKYGPADYCDLMKQRTCFNVEIIKRCNKWKIKDGCSEMKELAEECMTKYS